MQLSFGQILDALIEEKEVTPDYLEKVTGVSKRTIISWRGGLTKNPRNLEDILKIAKALNLTKLELDRLLEPTSHPAVDQLIAQEEFSQTLDWLTQTTSLAPFQAPRQPSTTIGREPLIQEITTQIRNGCPIYILHGLGGVGKTTIAIELAHQLRHDYPAGVLWIDLEPAVTDNVLNEEAIASALASCITAYGRSIEGSFTAASLKTVFSEVTNGKKLLIVLDNAHGNLDAEYFVPNSNQATVIVTSQNQQVLTRYKPCVYALEPLDIESGLKLLEEMIGSERVREDLSSAERIIKFLGGLPLAIKIVASDLDDMTDVTLEEYAEQLSDESEQLEYLESWRDETLNVRATFELSYKRLDIASQYLFAILSMFDGPDFSLEAITSLIAGEKVLKTKRRLARLQSLSLVGESHLANGHTADKRNARYQMHPLVRAFAREKLMTHLPDPALERRYIMFFAQLAENYRMQSGHTALEQDWRNIHLALEKAAENNVPDLFEKIVLAITHVNMGMAGFLDASGRWHLALQLLNQTQQLVDYSERTTTQARLLMRLGAFNFRVHQLKQAKVYLEQSNDLVLQLPNQNHNALLRAQISGWRGQVAEEDKQEDFEDVLTWLQKGVNDLPEDPHQPEIYLERAFLHVLIARVRARFLGEIQAAQQFLEEKLPSLVDTPAYVRGLTVLGNLYLYQGKYRQAIETWDEGIEVAKRVGDQRGLFGFRQNKALLLASQGDFQHSIVEQEKLRDAYHQMGDIRKEIMMLVNLAEDYTFTGRFTQAAEYLELAEQKSEEYELAEAEIRTYLNKTQLALWQNDLETASESLNQAIGKNRTAQRLDLLSETNRFRVSLLYAQGKYQTALTELQNLLTNSAIDNREKGILQRLTGQTFVALHQPEEAIQAFQASISNLETEGARFELAMTREAWGIAYQKLTQSEAATEHLQAARAIFKELKLDYHLERLETIN